ncbi:hypothetical protein CDD81_7750 [Ophiocordyceps australis]|uniref:Uncharacterized protein n=1 Tax=Ophiocordyceps australis TaxID=1399860 RepID=A0A2C5Y2J2_9HYPO|nr:hypothetical protein CDD81_7750 [Ophiocordyceps australis]
MAWFKTLAVTALAATATGLPTLRKFSPRHVKSLASRQEGGAAPDSGLTDPDIFDFALTLEHLQAEFYKQGFAKFPDSDFQALGLSDQQLKDLKVMGKAEEDHEVLIQMTLAGAGIQPVQSCEYDFGFTDAKSMVDMALVFESIGVSAYLGAAPLVSDKALLSAAASITTVESRQQSVLRAFTGIEAVPQSFDAPLSPRSIFSMAAPFIKSCPEGSNLQIDPFPALEMKGGQDPMNMAVGSNVLVSMPAGAALGTSNAQAAGPTKCAFTSGGVRPAGSVFTDFSESTGCQVPPDVAGFTYLFLTSSEPAGGAVTDDIVMAGPMPLKVS